MRNFSTIVPWDMTEVELTQMISNLYTAKNWKLSHATVKLENGMEYRVSVDDIDDYREAKSSRFGIHTGARV